MAPAAIGPALSVLAGGLDRARAAQSEAAERIAASPFDVDAIVDLSIAGRAFEASAVAFSSVAETERTLIDLPPLGDPRYPRTSDDGGHRDPRPRQGVRRAARGRRARPARGGGRRLRLPRAERRRQVDDHPHPARPRLPERRRGLGVRARRRARAARVPAPRGGLRRAARVLRLPVGAAQPRDPRRPRRRGAARALRGAARAGRARDARWRPRQDVLQRDARAPRHRRRAARLAAGADPRRADDRPRPAGHRGGARAGRRARPRGPHNLPLQPPAVRGRAHLHARGDRHLRPRDRPGHHRRARRRRPPLPRGDRRRRAARRPPWRRCGAWRSRRRCRAPCTVELLDGAAPSDLARAVLASGASLDALVPQRRTLEDAFLEATER